MILEIISGGFKPELTVVENVYPYGAVMRMNRAEMYSKLDVKNCGTFDIQGQWISK
jgi:ABC-type polysaccharide/polyol phosphate transport system ATPase subunit